MVGISKHYNSHGHHPNLDGATCFLTLVRLSGLKMPGHKSI